MRRWDRTKPRIYDPRLGRAVNSAPPVPTKKINPVEVSDRVGKKRKKKSKSTSVWSIPGGLPETNRRRH
jgi:ADP-ribose pyrophosphatase YjhB (NUDIX family)